MAENIKFEELCQLMEQIHKKRKHRAEQDLLLFNFINDIKIQTVGNTNSTLFPILRLLLPKLERERRAYNLKETKLGALLVKVLSLPKESRDAQKLLNFRSVSNTPESDFAGVAYFLVKRRINAKCDPFTIGDINNYLDKIASAEVGNKATVLDETFSYVINKLNPDQFKWFLRIILKNMKLEMSTTRILAAFHPDAPEYYEKCSDLAKVCEELGDGDARPLELGIQIFSAVSPMLSERLDVKNIGKLSPNTQYIIENKFDGERFQIHMQNGVFEYFTRRGFRNSSNYGKTYDSGLLTPYLKESLKPNVTSFILDGEMMGWHKQQHRFSCKGIPFDVKKITDQSVYAPCFCAFDVLYYNGKGLVGPADKGGLPLHERLRILDDIFVNVTGVIQHSVRHEVKQRSDILNALNKAIDNQDEGIVVKDYNSYYIPNKRNSGWYKIKPEYTEGTMDDLDLVIIGADEAENKTQGRANSFLVACSDGGEPGKMPERWVGVGRVSSGLKSSDLEALCATLQRHWVPYSSAPPPPELVFQKEKPDFWILPEHSIVLTVRATELIKSSNFGAGYTLRFPRVTRLRDDKPVRDVITLQELQQLVRNKGDQTVIKLSTNKIDETVIGVEVKVTRKRKIEAPQVPAKFLVPKREEGESATSRALFGRKIHIISGDDDLTTAELAKLVMSHGGTVVAHNGADTWVSVAGRMSKRIRDVISTQSVDITTTKWLRSLPPSEEPAHIRPVDYLSIKTATRLSLARNYDKYGDSYTEPADEDTLRNIFDKMSDDDIPILTNKEMFDVDKELFGDINPFSFLRTCRIYFLNENTILATLARMYGARVCEDLKDKNCTHIVVSNKDQVSEVKKRDLKALIVSEHWLNDCFSKKEFVSENRYLL